MTKTIAWKTKKDHWSKHNNIKYLSGS